LALGYIIQSLFISLLIDQYIDLDVGVLIYFVGTFLHCEPPYRKPNASVTMLNLIDNSSINFHVIKIITSSIIQRVTA
jgi:hypothetical protein